MWGNSIALMLAVLFVLVPVLEAPLLKLALASYCMPIVAIGPILYVVLSGSSPRVAVAAISVIFTTLVGALVGLRSADAMSLDLVRAYGGGRWAQLAKVRFKAALPATFAGLAIAGPAAVLGAIIGEYLGGQTGLGTTMVLAEQAFDLQRVWAIAVVATGLARRRLSGHTGRRSPADPVGAPGHAGDDHQCGQCSAGRRGAAPPRREPATSGRRPRIPGLGGGGPSAHGAGLALTIGVTLGVWQGFIWFFHLNPYFAKGPGAIFDYLFIGPGAAAPGTQILSNLAVTLYDALLGYVAGTFAAIGVRWRSS